jgi:hypothetical protein
MRSHFAALLKLPSRRLARHLDINAAGGLALHTVRRSEHTGAGRIALAVHVKLTQSWTRGRAPGGNRLPATSLPRTATDDPGWPAARNR